MGWSKAAGFFVGCGLGGLLLVAGRAGAGLADWTYPATAHAFALRQGPKAGALAKSVIVAGPEEVPVQRPKGSTSLRRPGAREAPVQQPATTNPVSTTSFLEPGARTGPGLISPVSSRAPVGELWRPNSAQLPDDFRAPMLWAPNEARLPSGRFLAATRVATWNPDSALLPIRPAWEPDTAFLP